MKALPVVVRRSLWVALGAAAVLVAGCAGMSGQGPTTLSGSQVVPPVSTTASGITDISLGLTKCPSAASSATNCAGVFGSVMTSGMAATAAHIHQGAAGQNGPVILPLVKTSDNVWSVPANRALSDAQYAAYWAGQLYVQAHSDAHKGGEIRAQLKP